MKWLILSSNKKKKLKVEFCEKNLDRFLKDEDVPLFEDFLKKPNVTYKEYECQSHCEMCKKQAYAIVNGEIISAPTTKVLIKKLQEC